MTFVKRHDINEFISDNELNSRIYDILLYLQDSCKNGRIPLKRKPLEIFNQAYCLCEILAAEKYPENCIHALWNKTSEQFLDYETNIIFSCVCVILSFSETNNNNIPHCVQRIKNIVNSSYFSEFENVLNEDLSLTPELPKNFKQLKEQADLISNTSEKLLFYRKTLTQIKQSKNKKNIVQQIEDEIHLIESTQLIENTKQNDIPISTEKEIPTKVRTVVIMEMLKKMNCGKDVNDLSSICRLVALLTGRSYDKIYNEAQKGISFTNYHNEDIKKVNEVLTSLNTNILIKKDKEY